MILRIKSFVRLATLMLVIRVFYFLASVVKDDALAQIFSCGITRAPQVAYFLE